MIGVLLDATAHAAGVVGENPAQRAGRDGCRIGADLRAIGRQRLVGAPADDARLHANLPATLFHPQLAPVPRNLHQQAIGDRLPRQARPGSAEGHRDLHLLAEAEEGPNFLDTLCLHNSLGNQPVETGIRSEGDEVDGTNQNAIGGNRAGQRSLDLLWRDLRGRENSSGHALQPQIRFPHFVHAGYLLRFALDRDTSFGEHISVVAYGQG